MPTTPLGFLKAALWPIVIWGSIGHLKEDRDDDYISLSARIFAFAVAFWLCVAGLVLLYLRLRTRMIQVDAGGVTVHLVVRYLGWELVLGSVLLFTPVIYVIGLWLFVVRLAKYPK